jgi:hypothetical protein
MERRPLATPKQLSEYLAVPEATLTNWRYLNTGPRYTKVGQLVRYSWDDIETWLSASRKQAV